MQGDELENKTVVVEECWEVQRAAIAAGCDEGAGFGGAMHVKAL